MNWMTVEGRNLQMTGRLETGSGGRGQKTAGPWLGFVGDELERWWGRCNPEDSAGMNQGQLVARVGGMVSWGLKWYS